jgi:multiple sugar transport system substrate-binding protein
MRGGAWEPREPGEAMSVPLLGPAGVLASVTMASRQPKAAEGFLTWLSIGEESPQIVTSYPRATPFRWSQLNNPQPWLPDGISSDATSEYVTALRQTHERSVYLLSPRMPGADEYLAAIEAAIAQAARGTPAAEALAAAAMQMDQITERLGRTDQSRAYQRSLGLDV